MKALLGILLIFGGIAMWAYAIIEQSAVADQVKASSRTGQPPRFWPVEWQGWRPDAGDVVAPPQGPKRLASARIVEHRIGRANVSFFNSIRFYQAKYVYPDGSTEISLAQGPRSALERPLSFHIVVWTMMLAGAGSLVLAWRSRSSA